MFLRLCGPPSIPLSFTVAGVLPGGILNAFAWPLAVYRKQRVFIVYCVDYRGYLILFDTHTFEHQRQLQSSKLPSQSEFFVISKHFTATPRIPPTSAALKTTSINCNFTVEPQTFTTDLIIRLRSL